MTARRRFGVIGAIFAAAAAALALAACDEGYQEVAVVTAEPAAPAVPVAESPYTYLLAIGTIRELNGFIEANPTAPEVPAAQARIAKLQQDRSIWEPVAASGDEASLRTFLLNYPGHVAEAEARELLRPFEGTDLYALIAAGSVSLEASGAGLTAVSLSLRNLTDQPIRALVPAGAYFQSADASVQNMVVTDPRTVLLPAGGEPTTATIAAACANLHLSEPHGGHGFTLAPEPLSGDVTRVLASAGPLDLTSRQAAVWILTDDANYSDLSVLNTMAGGYAAKGARLVAESGVDLSSRRIWDDMPYLLVETMRSRWEDDALWIWNAIGRPLQPTELTEYDHPYLADAVECGCLRVMDALIEAGADVNQRFPHFAGETRAISLVQERATAERLLAAGAVIDGPELWERAVRVGMTDVVALLHERGVPPPSNVPLLALAQGNVEMIRILLDAGMPLDQADENGRTPLHAALNSPEGLALLLAAGADPNALDGSGRSVLRAAFDPAYFGPPAGVVTQLLEAGADPFERDERGDTLLHELARLGTDQGSVRILLAAGLDPNVVNAEGQTALHTAAQTTHYVTDFVTTLVDAGARRTRDANGRLPEDVISERNTAPDELRAALARAPEQ